MAMLNNQKVYIKLMKVSLKHMIEFCYVSSIQL